MTKKELNVYLTLFNTYMNNTHESNDAAKYKSGAKQFVKFIEDNGILQPDTNEILQDSYGECAKLKQ